MNKEENKTENQKQKQDENKKTSNEFGLLMYEQRQPISASPNNWTILGSSKTILAPESGMIKSITGQILVIECGGIELSILNAAHILLNENDLFKKGQHLGSVKSGIKLRCKKLPW